MYKIKVAHQKPGNLKFCAPFNEKTVIGLVGIFKNRGKERIKQK